MLIGGGVFCFEFRKRKVDELLARVLGERKMANSPLQLVAVGGFTVTMLTPNRVQQPHSAEPSHHLS